MKKILKYFILIICGGLLLVSCEEKESNYAAMTKDLDKSNTTYYLRFANASGVLQTSFTQDGTPTDVVTDINVGLLGAPQASDVTVNLAVNSKSTLESQMYSLSATSITIPAGKTSGTISLTVLAAEMPDCTPLDLIIDLNNGDNNATEGTTWNYTFSKNAPLGELSTWVGTWGGFDSEGYESQVVTTLPGTDLLIDGLNIGWMEDFWGETITEHVPVIITMKGSGTIVIDKQYFMTTDYEGKEYKYEVDGTGTWDGCKKSMTITYTVYYVGDVSPAWTTFPITEKITIK